MSTVNLVSDSISCQHCAMAIKRELATVEGVRVVGVDVPTKVITLEISDDAALKRASVALSEIGYPARLRS
jgi:copper chaperone CopZ